MADDRTLVWAKKNQDEIAALLKSESRALAISLPDEALAETRAFQKALQEHLPNGKLFAAHKATNRTHVVKRLVEELGIGADVASLGELDACLSQGINAEDIILTGPKSDELLAHAVSVHVRAIVVDSLGELERLVALEAQEYPDILLRLSRSILNRPGVKRLSRFGFDKAGYEAALEILRVTPQIRLRGLAFHLDTKSVDEKIHAAHTALGLLAELPDQGFLDASVLDIGGGFGHAYGVTPDEFNTFDTAFRAAVQSETLTTYQAMPYGLKKLPDGQIVGDYTPMDLPGFPAGTKRLQALLTADSFAKKADELLVDIWCEPGSALFTEAGIVISEIIDVTPRDGRLDIVTNIHHGQVLFDRNEVLADPIHIPLAPADAAEYTGYLFGVLCMESDILSHRPVEFQQKPHPGDMLLWPHTGAYRMHMSQTNAIMHPDMAKYRYENNQFTKDEA